MRIAVTGHRGLSPAVAAVVDHAIRRELEPYAKNGELVGLSCLADGADQIFAAAVLDLGGELEAVVPSREYRDGLPDTARQHYDEQLSRAIVVHRLDYQASTPQAHMDASVFMVDKADCLFAVWDGLPARAFGGTADVVGYTRTRGIPVTVIWPAGATRQS
jgi:hypothetical protein